MTDMPVYLDQPIVVIGLCPPNHFVRRPAPMQACELLRPKRQIYTLNAVRLVIGRACDKPVCARRSNHQTSCSPTSVHFDRTLSDKSHRRHLQVSPFERHIQILLRERPVEIDTRTSKVLLHGRARHTGIRADGRIGVGVGRGARYSNRSARGVWPSEVKVRTGGRDGGVAVVGRHRTARPPAADAAPHVADHAAAPARHPAAHRRVLALPAHAPPRVRERERFQPCFVLRVDRPPVLGLWDLLARFVVLVVLVFGVAP